MANLAKNWINLHARDVRKNDLVFAREPAGVRSAWNRVVENGRAARADHVRIRFADGHYIDIDAFEDLAVCRVRVVPGGLSRSSTAAGPSKPSPSR